MAIRRTIPRKEKPGYIVGLDRSYNLNNGLVFFALPGLNNVDLVSKINPFGIGTAYEKIGNDFNNIENVNSYIDYPKDEMPDISNGFTVFFDVIMQHAHDEPTTQSRTFLDTNGNLGDGIRMFHTNGAGQNFRFRLIAGGAAVNLNTDTVDFSIGDRVTYAATWDKSTMRSYEGGVLKGSAAQAGALAAATFDDWRVGMTHDTPTTDESLLAHYKSMIIYSRALSDEEIKQLHESTYQALQPIVKYIPVFEAVVAGFKPYWAVSSTVTLGANKL